MKSAKKPLLLGAAILGALAAAQPAAAAVQPHGMFTDGAVLQRGIRVPVWGTADTSENVTVEFNGQKVRAENNNGKWMAWLKPLKADSAGKTLTITGQNKVEIKNVLVGEVWICSGQSNMEWPLWNTENGEQAVSSASDPHLRLLTVAKATSLTPITDLKTSWNETTPAAARNFSAVGYYFGKELRKRLNVPIGLINTSWGGTVAEAWTSQPALEQEAALSPILQNFRNAKQNYPAAVNAYQQALATYTVEADKAKAEGRQAPQAPRPPSSPYDAGNPNRPAVLYNAMIRPLVPYGIRGAIWYQGESNAGRAWEYQTLFPTMIKNWRQDFGVGDFPFLLVQLAPFMAIQKEPQDSAWAELREAQRLTTLSLPNTAQAVITDVGEEQDIHPRKKEPVGVRLALAALEHTYGLDIQSSGPTYDRVKFEDGRAIVSFKNVGGGLVAQGGALTGFTIAGADGKFYNATATIDGSKVVVSSPQVKSPAAVRYGWANFPVVNLANKEGIPASPFRTDSFRLTTQPK